MGKCKDCRHYQPECYGPDCECPKMIYGYGNSHTLQSDEVAIETDEGWGIIIGPEFGCIHFEEKP